MFEAVKGEEDKRRNLVRERLTAANKVLVRKEFEEKARKLFVNFKQHPEQDYVDKEVELAWIGFCLAKGIEP